MVILGEFCIMLLENYHLLENARNLFLLQLHDDRITTI